MKHTKEDLQTVLIDLVRQGLIVKVGNRYFHHATAPKIGGAA